MSFFLLIKSEFNLQSIARLKHLTKINGYFMQF